MVSVICIDQKGDFVFFSIITLDDEGKSGLHYNNSAKRKGPQKKESG